MKYLFLILKKRGPTGATDDIGFLRSMAHGSSDCRGTKFKNK
jgi:hypothetical protein